MDLLFFSECILTTNDNQSSIKLLYALLIPIIDNKYIIIR